MLNFSDWDIIRNLLLAARWTLWLSLVAFAFGSIVTCGLLLLHLTGSKLLQSLITLYRWLFQGTPLLLQLFLAFFGLALFGINLTAWQAAALALTLYTSAYLFDVWLGSIQAIPLAQWQAGRCLGLNILQSLNYIILPQAFRIALAPTIGLLVQVIKATALTSIIGFVELTKAGSLLSNVTYQPFKVYGLVALGYFLLCYPLSLLSRYLEKLANAAYHH
jgi:polar amino acid transport system permease protein